MQNIFLTIVFLVVVAVAGYLWFSPNFAAIPAPNPTSTPERVMYTDKQNTYTVEVPDGWYPHEQGTSSQRVIFTPSATFTLPESTEGYAIGDQMVIAVGGYDEIEDAETSEDYLRGIGATSTSEFFVERRNVRSPKGIQFERVVMNAATADGQTLFYIAFPGSRKVITLSHYPYVASSMAARDFETLFNSFTLKTAPATSTSTTTKTR